MQIIMPLSKKNASDIVRSPIWSKKQGNKKQGRIRKILKKGGRQYRGVFIKQEVRNPLPTMLKVDTDSPQIQEANIALFVAAYFDY